MSRLAAAGLFRYCSQAESNSVGLGQAESDRAPAGCSQAESDWPAGLAARPGMVV